MLQSDTLAGFDKELRVHMMFYFAANLGKFNLWACVGGGGGDQNVRLLLAYISL